MIETREQVLRAVLDANVYISAVIRPQGPPGQIVELFLREAAFEVVLSPRIVEEVLRAFSYPKLRKYLPRTFKAEQWFGDIALLAQLVAGEYDVAGICDDPDDDKYIAAALEGRAGFIVAGDSDLLKIKRYQDVRIVNPRTFLNLLRQ